MKKLIVFTALFCLLPPVFAQQRDNDVKEEFKMNRSTVREQIRIPSIDNYIPLKCDFHIHTVFSDGAVWPDVRVDEAWQNGLDAIAITDHIEYRPKRDIIKGDLNESYNIAKKQGDAIGFIVIKGTEITRAMPLGHLNALFIKDAVAIENADPLQSIDEAVKQGAFIMWNHPGWPDDTTVMYPVHEKLIKEGKIHGIEVFNQYEYYPRSFDWCNTHKLAYMANSDIHGPITQDYGFGFNTRPITIVFATDRSEKALHEALRAARTATLFNGKLAGDEAILKKMVIEAIATHVLTPSKMEVVNTSDIQFRITNGSATWILPAGKSIRIDTPNDETVYTVENCYTGMNQQLKLTGADLKR